MKATIRVCKTTAPARLTIGIQTENPEVHVAITTPPGAPSQAFEAAVKLAWVVANEVNPEDALAAFEKLNAEVEGALQKRSRVKDEDAVSVAVIGFGCALALLTIGVVLTAVALFGFLRGLALLCFIAAAAILWRVRRELREPKKAPAEKAGGA